jgi:hypothetical protein
MDGDLGELANRDSDGNASTNGKKKTGNNERSGGSDQKSGKSATGRTGDNVGRSPEKSASSVKSSLASPEGKHRLETRARTGR